MPALKTTPGACPAQVLIPTTSGRPSLPEPASAAPVTPSEPFPRSASAGALLSASKSAASTPEAFPAASPFSAPAHFRTVSPL